MRKQTAVVEILLLKMVLKKYEIHVKSIEDFNENIRIVKFRFDISSFDILPGGFVMLWKEGYLDERGILIKRAYSVASSVENKNYLEICFKIEESGRFSKIVKETLDATNMPIYSEVSMYSDEQLKELEDKCIELHYQKGLVSPIFLLISYYNQRN